MVRHAAFLLTLLAIAVPSFSDEGHHHDELTDQQLGTVHFSTSCAGGVQKQFERGIALLHSFAFDAAEQTFREVLKNDPACAMAHWGIAKSKWRWDTDAPRRQQGAEEIRAGERLHPHTSRERDYLKAMGKFYSHPSDDKFNRGQAFNRAMERLIRKNPEDHEAQIFYAWSLISSDDDTHAARKKAAAILEKLFVEEPNHPGVAHYLIHAYDTPAMVELGLPAARRYAKIAPDAAHALHMPSHIFARLGLWQEDIDSNLASIAASRNAAATHMSDEGHQYHAMEFLIYAYLQSGQDAKAQQLIEEVRSLPKMKNMYGTDSDPQISALTAFTAAYALELHHWEEAEALPIISPLDSGDISITYKARAIGAVHNGHLQVARTNLLAIQNLQATYVAQKKPVMWANAVADDAREVTALIDHAEGRNDAALGALRETAKKEGGVFSPDGGIPAHEMLGDILNEMGKPEQALAEYEAELKLSPNRFNSVYGAGQASEAARSPAKAAAYYQQLLKACAGGDSTRPEIRHAQQYTSAVARQ